MREEERVRREIEKAQADAEKEERRYEAALERARRELQEAGEQKRAELEEEIAKLQGRLDKAHTAKERAVSRAQMTKSGHVYVVSNIGSFGGNVYKIGLTRRLEPADRVRELGDASVPFPFDVHAMVFSEDAPGLEQTLHRAFDDRRVNLVNTRKEFFAVSLPEIESAAQEHGTVEFTLAAEAEEYRKTLALREARNASAAEGRARGPGRSRRKVQTGATPSCLGLIFTSSEAETRRGSWPPAPRSRRRPAHALRPTPTAYRNPHRDPVAVATAEEAGNAVERVLYPEVTDGVEKGLVRVSRVTVAGSLPPVR